MKKAFLIFSNTLRRSWTMTIVALCCGAVMCVLFAFIDTLASGSFAGIPIGLSTHEDTVAANDLQVYLADELGMKVTQSDDIDYLNTELVERHIAAVVEVPVGFEAGLLAGNPPQIEARFLDDYANAAFVRGYLESYTASLAALATGADSSPEKLEEMITDMRDSMASVDTVALDSSSISALSQQNAFRSIVGFYMLFAFMLGLVSALQLFDDRRSGLYDRVKVSDVSTTEYLVGTCSVGLVNAVALIAPFFVYISVAEPSIGMHIWQVVSLCLLYAVFVVCVAVAAAVHLATKNSIIFAIISVGTIMCVMGGAYFPIDASPLFLQRLARATPQFWFMDAVNTLQEDPDASWWLNAVIIALFALFFFILAGIRFVRQGKKKLG